MALLVASQYEMPGYGDRRVWVRGQAGPIIVSGYSGVCLKLNSRAGTEGSTVSSLICDRWLILGIETLGISRCLTTDNRWPPAVCLAGH